MVLLRLRGKGASESFRDQEILGSEQAAFYNSYNKKCI